MLRKTALTLILLFGATVARADVIAVYDYLQADVSVAPNGTTLEPATVAAGFTASDLVLTNASNTATAFGNHFYHNQWDAGLNTSKYYEATIGSADDFVLDDVSFSLENTSGNSTYWLRSSLDGFVGDIASGAFTALVTDFSVDLTSLGVLTSPVAFRWYMSAANGSTIAGFSNHQCDPGPLFDAGCGLSDVGTDLIFSGSSAVPEPGILSLLAMSLLGLGYIRRRKIA